MHFAGSPRYRAQGTRNVEGQVQQYILFTSYLLLLRASVTRLSVIDEIERARFEVWTRELLQPATCPYVFIGCYTFSDCCTLKEEMSKKKKKYSFSGLFSNEENIKWWRKYKNRERKHSSSIFKYKRIELKLNLNFNKYLNLNKYVITVNHRINISLLLSAKKLMGERKKRKERKGKRIVRPTNCWLVESRGFFNVATAAAISWMFSSRYDYYSLELSYFRANAAESVALRC